MISACFNLNLQLFRIIPNYSIKKFCDIGDLDCLVRQIRWCPFLGVNEASRNSRPGFNLNLREPMSHDESYSSILVPLLSFYFPDFSNVSNVSDDYVAMLSCKLTEAKGLKPSFKSYAGMPHSACAEECLVLDLWMWNLRIPWESMSSWDTLSGWWFGTGNSDW